MRLLFIHSDHLEYEARNPVGDVAEPMEGDRVRSFDECLVVFITVETEDGDHGKGLVERVADEITGVMGQVDAPRVVLYPWSHLSSDLAPAHVAVPLLKEIELELLSRDVITDRAAFGWYKSFTLNCKGHPLAELARHITFEEEGELGVSKAVYDEERLRPTWHVFTPEGDLFEADSFNFAGHDDLRTFVAYETKKDRTSKGQPAHIELMQRHELVDYEPGSDSGNLRWYPKGKLMKVLLEHLIRDLCHRAGAMEVETPQMYDLEHPSLKRYMERFPARQYIVLSDKKRYFLRFAACFGQFLTAAGMNISYRNLPLRLFEITRQSFRREKSGEVMGLRRLRSFTMPDLHTLCADVPQAKVEFFDQFELSREWMRSLDVPYETAFRALTEFFHEHRDWYERMVRTLGRPVLLELFDERFAYFITKFEFNVVDTQAKAGAISTVQIDVENGELYGIEYTAADGSRHNPIILHTSVSGATERCLYAILEWQARRMAQGEKGEFPFWLAPTQVRFVSVSEQYVEPCLEMAAVLDGVARADVDDRDERVGKKVRGSETEWVPITIVYGEKEAHSDGLLPVRFRSGETRDMTIEELRLFLEGEMEGYPFEPMPLPVRVSLRPGFRS